MKATFTAETMPTDRIDPAFENRPLVMARGFAVSLRRKDGRGQMLETVATIKLSP